MKENKNIGKYLDLDWELKSAEHEGDVDTNCNWSPSNSFLKHGKETGELKIRESIDTNQITAL